MKTIGFIIIILVICFEIIKYYKKYKKKGDENFIKQKYNIEIKVTGVPEQLEPSKKDVKRIVKVSKVPATLKFPTPLAEVDKTYPVPSESDPSQFYLVNIKNLSWQCMLRW